MFILFIFLLLAILFYIFYCTDKSLIYVLNEW